MDTRFDILDAFMDGEPVNPAALKSALAEPAGRDYFVDAWLLRGAVREEMAAEQVPPFRDRPAPARWSLVAAAAIAAVCLAGGYAIGVRFAPAPVAPATERPAVDVSTPPASTSFPLPPATRVIRLELDPNWKERSGGS